MALSPWWIPDNWANVKWVPAIFWFIMTLCRPSPRFFSSFCPFSYTYFSPEKRFTPSQTGNFLLISMGFKCEGSDFQVFTVWEAFCRGCPFVYRRFAMWRFAAPKVHVCFTHVSLAVHVSFTYSHPAAAWCEWLKIQTFTFKIIENQQESTVVWRVGHFFREFKNVYVCACA